LAAVVALMIGSLILFSKTTGQAVIVSGVCVVAIFIAAYPQAFFILFLVLRPAMDLIAEKPIIGSINSASIATVFFILIGSSFVLRRENMARISASKVMVTANKIFLYFLAISLISTINSSDYVASLADWLRLVSVIVVFNYGYLYFSNNKTFKRLFTIISLSVFAPLCFGMYQYLFNTGDHFTLGFNRIYGTFQHPNVFALYLVFFFLMGLYFLRAYQPLKIGKFVSYLILAVVLFEIFHTYTRSAWIALAASLMVFSLAYKKYNKSVYFIFIFAVLLVFLPRLHERFVDIKSHNISQPNSWQWRLNVWAQTAAEIKDHSLIGHGLGMYEKKFLFMAHNDYLRLAYETGIPGLGAYLSFLFFIFVQSAKKIRPEKNMFLRSRHITIISLLIVFILMAAVDNLARSTVVALYIFCVIGALSAPETV
jgi:putative inorganic carbon (HCO3(-)) transporter